MKNKNLHLVQKYNLSQAARMMKIPGAGRNKIYKLLREEGMVSEYNKPAQRYVDLGYFAVGRHIIAGRYVTLVVGLAGVLFLRQVILNYLLLHSMPSFPRKKAFYYNDEY